MSWSCLHNKTINEDGVRRIALFNEGLLVWFDAQTKSGKATMQSIKMNRHGEDVPLNASSYALWQKGLDQWMNERGSELMSTLGTSTSIKLNFKRLPKLALDNVDPGQIINLINTLAKEGKLTLNSLDSKFRALGIDANSHQVKAVVDNWVASRGESVEQQLAKMEPIINPPSARMPPPSFNYDVPHKHRPKPT
jgi:hypothetical protein